MNLWMFSKEVDWHVTYEARTSNFQLISWRSWIFSLSFTVSCGLRSNVRWSDYSYYNAFDFTTSNNIIMSLRTVYFYFAIDYLMWLILRLSFFEDYVFLYLNFLVICVRFSSRIFLYMDSVRQRSSWTWDVYEQKSRKTHWTFFEVDVFYKKFWDILGQLNVSASVSKKKRELLQTHKVLELYLTLFSSLSSRSWTELIIQITP